MSRVSSVYIKSEVKTGVINSSFCERYYKQVEDILYIHEVDKDVLTTDWGELEYFYRVVVDPETLETKYIKDGY